MTSEQLDLATWPLFHKMSSRGLLVDVGKLKTLKAEVEELVLEQEELIGELVDWPLNTASGSDVAKYMVEMGLQGKQTRGKTRLATDERSLATHDDPVLEAVVAKRGYDKLINTFIDPVLEKAEKPPHTVHPRWRLTKVRSGRVATEDPNLLAFPSRDDLGLKVRSCFVARPGYRMLSVDFSQLEPRIVTALSQDPKLLEVYRSGKDLYVDVAENLGVTRTAAKTITLGILYGMMGQRLFEQLQLNGCTQGNPPMPIYDLDACEKLIDAWFDAYPKVKMLVGTTVAAAKMCGGKAMTIGGRGRMLPGLFLDGWGWPNEKLRQEAERQAFNHLIQGTGMEVLRRGMLEVDESFRTVHMLLAIHDELVMEVEDAHAETLAPQIANSMVQRMEGVELKTTYCLGDSWGELKG